MAYCPVAFLYDMEKLFEGFLFVFFFILDLLLFTILVILKYYSPLLGPINAPLLLETSLQRGGGRPNSAWKKSQLCDKNRNGLEQKRI